MLLRSLQQLKKARVTINDYNREILVYHVTSMQACILNYKYSLIEHSGLIYVLVESTRLKLSINVKDVYQHYRYTPYTPQSYILPLKYMVSVHDTLCTYICSIAIF